MPIRGQEVDFTSCLCRFQARIQLVYTHTLRELGIHLPLARSHDPLIANLLNVSSFLGHLTKKEESFYAY